MTRIHPLFNTESDPPKLVQPDHALWPKVRDALMAVQDPDIGVSIYELGLIRKVTMTDNADKTGVHVDMMLTSYNCPMADILPREAETAIMVIDDNFTPVIVNVVMEQWQPEFRSANAELAMNFW